MRRLWMIGLALALVAAACSDGDDEVSATPEVVVAGDTSADSGSDDDAGTSDGASADGAASSDEEQALEFVQCMRDNGVDLPDPTVEADGSVNLTPPGGPGGGGIDLDNDATQAAFEECSDRLDGASFLPTDDDLTDIEDQLLDVAQCLRDQGIDVDDPDLSAGFGGGGNGGPFGPGFDPDDPATAAALDACSGIFTGFGPGGQSS